MFMCPPGNWAVRGTGCPPTAEGCFALLCILLWKEQGLVSACSFFFLAALLCMQLETLPACLLTAAREDFRDVYRFFFLSHFFLWLLGPVVKINQTSNHSPRVLRLWMFNSAFRGGVSGPVKEDRSVAPWSPGPPSSVLCPPSRWHQLCSIAHPGQRLPGD